MSQSWTDGDRGHMRRALELACKGLGATKPNPLVGAVIVKDGQVIAEGWHKRLGGLHAEREALALAGDAARGATMYVTLEPCNHHGRTPPCTEAIMEAGISRVIVAGCDPNPLVSGSGIRRMRDAGIEVQCGLLEDEAGALNEPFLTAMRNQRPFVLLKAALSLDGFIATKSGDSGQTTGGMSSAEAFAEVHASRAALDAIMVGINTVRMDNPRLTVRGMGDDVIQPIKIVLDPSLSIDPGAKLFEDARGRVLLYCREDADPARHKIIEDAGGVVIPLAADAQGRLSAADILKDMWERCITSVLVEGGAHVHRTFIAEGLFDRLCLFATPCIFGEGVPFCHPFGVTDLKDAPQLDIISARMVGSDVMICARPKQD